MQRSPQRQSGAGLRNNLETLSRVHHIPYFTDRMYGTTTRSRAGKIPPPARQRPPLLDVRGGSPTVATPAAPLNAADSRDPAAANRRVFRDPVPVSDPYSTRAREPSTIGTRAVATADVLATATPYTSGAVTVFPASTNHHARVRRSCLSTPWRCSPTSRRWLKRIPQLASAAATCGAAASRPRGSGGAVAAGGDARGARAGQPTAVERRWGATETTMSSLRGEVVLLTARLQASRVFQTNQPDRQLNENGPQALR